MRTYNPASFDASFDNMQSFDTSMQEVYTFDASMQELTMVYGDDHTQLKNRDAANQHPIESITGLQAELDSKQAVLTAGNGIIISNDIISLDQLILNCGTSTTVI